MSIVFWSNYLIDGCVTSDESDKYALYKHAKKLDHITRRLGVTPFMDFQDTTDLEFNVSDAELPQGMESTDELMASDGNWLDANLAVAMIEALLNEIKSNNIRFGMITNIHDDIVAELAESLEFARKAAEKSAGFNFAVIM